MKTMVMRFEPGRIILFATLGILAAGDALAITIGLSPSAQTVGPADSFSLDVVVSELGGEIVSAYDLDVLFDSAVVTATSVNFGPELGDEASFEVFNDSNLATPGVIDFAQLSLLSDANLLALQGGDSVVLATLGFDAVGLGTSALEFSLSGSNQIVGLNAGILSVDISPASITVSAPEAPIPEPSAAVLFLVGAAVVNCQLRRSSSARRRGAKQTLRRISAA